jgi:hypothetical protein
VGSCFLAGSIDCDPGYPAQEHFAEQRVIEYSEADCGASAAAVEESAAATAVQKVCLANKKRATDYTQVEKDTCRIGSTTSYVRIHGHFFIYFKSKH